MAYYAIHSRLAASSKAHMMKKQVVNKTPTMTPNTKHISIPPILQVSFA